MYVNTLAIKTSIHGDPIHGMIRNDDDGNDNDNDDGGGAPRQEVYSMRGMLVVRRAVAQHLFEGACL